MWTRLLELNYKVYTEHVNIYYIDNIRSSLRLNHIHYSTIIWVTLYNQGSILMFYNNLFSVKYSYDYSITTILNNLAYMSVGI